MKKTYIAIDGSVQSWDDLPALVNSINVSMTRCAVALLIAWLAAGALLLA